MRYRVMLVAIALTPGCQGTTGVPAGKNSPKPVGQQLERIRAFWLAGQADLGSF
jgi:hypothetical protein